MKKHMGGGSGRAPRRNTQKGTTNQGLARTRGGHTSAARIGTSGNTAYKPGGWVGNQRKPMGNSRGVRPIGSG